MNVLTVIPAKLGSTRLPQKNILPLGGKPLLHWTIEAALASKCCGEVMVSTESERVAEIARQGGAVVPFMRPEYLSKDPYQVYEVCAHVLDEYEKRGRQFDVMVLLLPTSPFCSSTDIQGTFQVFMENNASSAISVSTFENDVFSAHSVNEDGVLTPLFPDLFKTPPHKRPVPYELNGAVTIVSITAFREQKTLCCQSAYAYRMDWRRSVDIDSPADFQYAEYLIEKGINRLTNKSPR